MESQIKPEDITYVTYSKEEELQAMIKMIEVELPEPYSIYTYRYFLSNWPNLTFLAYHGSRIVGVVMGKLDNHRGAQRGYVAMLVVEKEYRKLKIGSKLTTLFIDECKKQKADEVVLETEVINTAALRLYESLGFARDKRLKNYYMSGNDAFRLKLWLNPGKLLPKTGN